MKKVLSLLVMAFVTVSLYAQVPNTMSYSVMVMNPKTGQILQNKDVKLRVELRQGSAQGTAVWAQDFDTTTDRAGLCNLTLKFSDDINWSLGNYFFALLVDGEEVGAPALTSVPYALQAKTLEGAITKNELIGTWVYQDESDKETYVFNADGTGQRIEQEMGSSESYKDIASWTLTGAGSLIYAYYAGDKDGEEQRLNARAFHVLKISEKQIILTGADRGYLYTKQ